MVTYECHEDHILVVHIFIVDLGAAFDETQTQMVGAFREFCDDWIERAPVVFQQDGHLRTQVSDVNIGKMFLGTFPDGIVDNVIQEFLATESDAVVCGFRQLTFRKERTDIVERFSNILACNPY